MTLFLASVTDEAEAGIAIAGGADLVDFKDPARGALGALDLGALRAAKAAVAGRRQTSAVTGDLPMDPAALPEAVRAVAETGVDYVKVGLFDDPRRAACIAALVPLAATFKLIGVLFADETLELGVVAELAEAGFTGAMIDTAKKEAGRLLQIRDLAVLARFVDACHARKMLAGLAGSLEAPDVPRLLPLRPDILGFRGALCQQGERGQRLDPKAVSFIRDLIPREARAAPDDGDERVDYRLLVGRGYAVEPSDKAARTDRIFVHDFVLPVAIGAYRSERDGPQRVRFNVEAFVQRGAHAPADMRDILSYDLIMDAIRLIVAEGHHPLVEGLAERVAASVLGHARVTKVAVKIEKLDVAPAAVGVEITREKTAEAVILRHPAPQMGEGGSGGAA